MTVVQPLFKWEKEQTKIFLVTGWCEHYRQKYESVYQPASQSLSWWQRLLSLGKAKMPGLSGEDLEIQQRAETGKELFWGGAVCWWGEMRRQLTPDSDPFQQAIHCPIQGLLPPEHQQLDSHGIVQSYLGQLEGKLTEPEVLQKFPT